MANVRCSKCGSDKDFMAETQDKKTLKIAKPIDETRILKSVHITCLYCHNHWQHVPISLEDPLSNRDLSAQLTH